MSLRVLHLSTYSANGGAARAATALDSALQSVGVNSCLKTAQGARFMAAQRLDRAIWRLQRSPVSTWRSPALFGSLTAKEINASSADVVNLHWVTDGFLSIKEIGKITKPVVWSLYDMWPFCGTEHYGVDSTDARWRTGYSSENRPHYERGADIDRWAWDRKRENWHPMHMVPASSWLEDSVRQSVLMREWPSTRIPHAVNTDHFSPVGKLEARDQLGLPAQTPLILFLASAGIFDRRKGFDLLEQALTPVHEQHPDAHLVVAGPRSIDYVSPSGIPIIWHGNVEGNDALRLLYCSADVLAVPSREDNMPLTAMEAQSCGVPVVAFDIGGLPDIVDEEETGYLVPPGNTEKLGLAISKLLSDPTLRESFSLSATRHARETWSPEVVANLYLDVYSRVVA